MFPKRDDPFMLLVESMLMGDASKAIEHSEKRGQQILNDSEVLPHKFNSGTQEQLEKMGVVFGEKADDLFSYVTLPEGWKKQPTDHPMWSKLLDERGRERASIFYKAAFYDRDAFLNLSRKYNYSVEPVCGWDDENYKTAQWHCVVKDANKIIWKSNSIPPKPKYDKENRKPWDEWYSKRENLYSLGEAWLNKNFPEWKDVTAYWQGETK